MESKKKLVIPNNYKNLATAYKTNAKNTMANDKTTTKNALLKVAAIKQTGDKDFGLKEKTMYYLLVITDKGQLRINVGQKTYETIKELTS